MKIQFDFDELRDFLESIFEIEYGLCGDSFSVDYILSNDGIIRKKINYYNQERKWEDVLKGKISNK